MKRTIYKYLLISICALFSFQYLAVAGADVWADITTHVQTGNNTAIAQFFAENIEISINGTETTGKSACETSLKGFFQQNKPSSFVIKHKGSSKAGSQFSVGSLTTSAGNFRVQIVVQQQSNGEYNITSLEINKE